MLSKRGFQSKLTPNLLHEGWYRHNSNPYNAKTNPNGIINLGTAENRLIADILEDKLASINMGKMKSDYTHYCKFSGTDQFLDKLAVFLDQHLQCKEKLTRKDIFVMNGCGTVIESIGYSICDEGDGVLIPAPYYCGFKSDLEQRIGVKVIPVHTRQMKQGKMFQLTVNDLEDAFINSQIDGIQIKALLLTNPNNPLGTVYTEEELISYIEFCAVHNIHLICDEIYMLSVYDKKETFQSVLSLKNFSKHSDKIHVVWGFSKDFALSGFRCGVAITKNNQLKKALSSIAYYSSIPTPTQYILEELITDTYWLNKLIATNHRRLRVSREIVCKKLSKLKINCILPTSGLFIWMDLSKYLKSSNQLGEVNLFNELMDNGLYLAPGFAFESKTIGWFRLIISLERNILETGLQRFEKFIAQSVITDILSKMNMTSIHRTMSCSRDSLQRRS